MQSHETSASLEGRVNMEEHVYSILAIEGIIEREEKQQPELPPKYIKKHRQQHRRSECQQKVFGEKGKF